MITRALLLSSLSVLALSACGFQPMYGSHAAAKTASGQTAEAGLDSVGIANIPDAEGVYLRNALIDRFYRHGTPSNPRYELSFGDLNETKTNLDITTSSETTRAQLSQNIAVTLIDRQQGNKAVLLRNISSIASYNILESEFATRISEQNARQSGLDDMARQIELNLSLFFNRSPSDGL